MKKRNKKRHFKKDKGECYEIIIDSAIYITPVLETKCPT